MVTVLIAILTFIIGVISGAVLLAAVAILAAHDSMSDTPKSIPYRQAPIPLTEARHRQQQEEENHKKLNAGKEAMKQIMAGVNSKFKRKEE